MDANRARPIHGMSSRNGNETPLGQFTDPGKFGRIFPKLPPFTPSIQSLEELGKAMILEPQDDNTPDDPAGDNPAIPAGYTYLGQFIDHDITFDTASLKETLIDPLAIENFRTPTLDLDCLYGDGASGQPYIYERENPEKFLIGNTSLAPGGGDATIKTNLPHDLPRASNGFALIGDPRNDENLVVAQTHLAFLRFHNKVVDQLTDGTIPRQDPFSKTIFQEARTLVTWHYQWIILYDFLHRILDNEQLDLVRTQGRSFFLFDKRPFIPVEFSVAAYRLGHSMIRDVYNYNRVFRPGGVTGATLELLFRFSGRSGRNVPIPSDWIIDWRRFVELDSDITVNFSRKLDPFLVNPLSAVPDLPPIVLSVRNLLRGRSLGLPSGQSAAKFMGFTPLTRDEIATGTDGAVAKSLSFDVETPLWYYILKEAEVQQQGQRLGQVGSRIIAEVFWGLLEGDPTSFVVQNPAWNPTLPNRQGQVGTFELPDLIAFTGVLSPIDQPENIETATPQPVGSGV
jgi:hypothetical protein